MKLFKAIYEFLIVWGEEMYAYKIKNGKQFYYY